MSSYASTSRRGVLAGLLAADVAFAFQQTAILPALPIVGSAFSAPATWTAWLLSGYLLVSSIVTPLIGKLADNRGKRRILIGTLVLFLLGSVGAALSPHIGVLIGFRALQGIGGAVFPITFSIVRETLPAEWVGSAIGSLTGGFGVGTALGFGLGGLIAVTLSWRFVFAVGALPVAAAVIVVAVLVPPSAEVRTGRLDLAGGAILGGSLGAFLLGLTLGPQTGWATWYVVVLFAAAVLFFAQWINHELRASEPFVTLEVLRARPVLLTNLATLTIGYALFGVFFLVPHLVEAGGGQMRLGFESGAVTAGLILVPAAVGQLVGGPLAGAVQRRYAPKWPFTVGMVVAAGGMGSLALWHAHPWQLATAALFIGFGVGLAIGSSSTLVTQAVPERDTGISTTFNSTLRRVGGGVGSQVGAALLASLTVGGAGTPTGPGAVGAFVVAFAVAAGLSLIGACLAACVPRVAAT